jgi:serine/threonine protein kinase
MTYLVLEYAAGGTLYDRIKASSFNRNFVRRIFREICEAVHYMHTRGVMHRDIKVPHQLIKP